VTMRMVVVASMLVLLPIIGVPAGVEPLQVSGRYELLVCKGPCNSGSPSNVVVKGILVLAPGPLSAQLVKELGALHFELAYSIGGDPNGCFVLDTLTENRTFAGLMTYGLTFWRTYEDRVMFELYQSPDAGYFATVTLTRDGLQGSGGSSGGAGSDADLTPDVLVARRVGPGDIGPCIKLATERQRKSRGAA